VWYDPEVSSTYKGFGSSLGTRHIYTENGNFSAVPVHKFWVEITQPGKTDNAPKVLETIEQHVKNVRGAWIDHSAHKDLIDRNSVWKLHSRAAGMKTDKFEGDIQFGHANHEVTFVFEGGFYQTVPSLHVAQTRVNCGMWAHCYPWYIMSPFCMRPQTSDTNFYLLCADKQGNGFVKFGWFSGVAEKTPSNYTSNVPALFKASDVHSVPRQNETVGGLSHYAFYVVSENCRVQSNYNDCYAKSCSWFRGPGKKEICGAPFFCPIGYDRELRQWPGTGYNYYKETPCKLWADKDYRP